MEDVNEQIKWAERRLNFCRKEKDFKVVIPRYEGLLKTLHELKTLREKSKPSTTKGA